MQVHIYIDVIINLQVTPYQPKIRTKHLLVPLYTAFVFPQSNSLFTKQYCEITQLVKTTLFFVLIILPPKAPQNNFFQA